jgi:hypothetical protein
MARKRRPSDDVYNARRRVRRLAARLEREGKSDLAASYRAAAASGSGTTTQELDRIYAAGATAKANATGAQQRASRAKRPSDEVYNARRRLKRQAERLEREAAKQPGRIAEQMRSMAESLRRSAAEALGLKTNEQRQKALERLGMIRERTYGATEGMSSVYRRNLIFMQQLNAAGTEGADSSITQREKDVFWAAVKGLWPDGSQVPRNERYERVINHFYFTEHSDAQRFAQWLRDEKHTDIRDVAGDISLVFEYITTKLNDPSAYDAPEVDYDELMKLIRTLK